jgi:RNA polymerase sigma-70 factor (ECF subfamily)
MLHPTVLARLHDDPADLAGWAEVGALIDRALATLPEEQRRAFLLRDVEEWTMAEAAERLGVSESTARNRVRSARLTLREQLERVLG